MNTVHLWVVEDSMLYEKHLVLSKLLDFPLPTLKSKHHALYKYCMQIFYMQYANIQGIFYNDGFCPCPKGNILMQSKALCSILLV